MEIRSDEKLSVILPVRDAARSVRTQIWRTIEMFEGLYPRAVELIVVDDGSSDATVEALDDVRREIPTIRVIRHERPRGWEAAGQSGVERSTGTVVVIREDDRPFDADDVRRIVDLIADPTVMAARSESGRELTRDPIDRRFRAFGGEVRFDRPRRGSAVQMIRRDALTRRQPTSANREVRHLVTV